MLSSLATTSITVAKLLTIMMLHLISTELAAWSIRVDLTCSWLMARIQAHHTPLHHLSTWLVLLLIVLRIHLERMAAHVRLLSHLLLLVLEVAVVVVRWVLLLGNGYSMHQSFSDLIQLLTSDYIRLLNEPYLNRVNFREQNLS